MSVKSNLIVWVATVATEAIIIPSHISIGLDPESQVKFIGIISIIGLIVVGLTHILIPQIHEKSFM